MITDPTLLDFYNLFLVFQEDLWRIAGLLGGALAGIAFWMTFKGA